MEKTSAKERAERIHYMCFEDFHGNSRSELVGRIAAEMEAYASEVVAISQAIDSTCGKCKRAVSYFCRECFEGEKHQAEREAREKVCDEWCACPPEFPTCECGARKDSVYLLTPEQFALHLKRNKADGYKEGFKAGAEAAADEVRSYVYSKGLSLDLLEMTDLIEALKTPEGGKRE